MSARYLSVPVPVPCSLDLGASVLYWCCTVAFRRLRGTYDDIMPYSSKVDTDLYNKKGSLLLNYGTVV